MIGMNGITTQLIPLDASLFNCFDSIDEDDVDEVSLDEKLNKPETVFDGTGFGFDTFEKPVGKKTTVKKKTAKKAIIEQPEMLAEYATPQRRVELLTRTYEPSAYDNNTMIFPNPGDFDPVTKTYKSEAGRPDPRPQWTPPAAANDSQKRKHSFPALDEARNKTLMIGRDRAHTLIQNEWAFDILLEVRDLMDAATPVTSWLQHDGHGEADEHEPGDKVNSGYGLDLIHDYGPSENKVKRLWEHGNDNEPSKNGKPWNLGTVDKLNDVLSAPTNTMVKALDKVGALEMNERNHVTAFRDKKGNWLKFKTKTRRAKGKCAHPKVIPDPADTEMYDGAALPRNRRGELAVGFFGGKTASSNSTKPDTLRYIPEAGPSHSSNDPWAATTAADKARDDATIKLSHFRLLVGDQPYDAITQAASGFRIGELCGGKLGNTTDSARGRNLLQVAIERIIEDRSRLFNRSKKAA